VITDLTGRAIHIVAGIPGATHDFRLFQDNIPSVEQLVAQHPGEPVAILGDKGYKGKVNSKTILLVTPYKTPRNGRLSQTQLFENIILSRKRVVVENYFGRLSGKFRVLVHRWNHDDELYP
jgi:hypothetical protein